MSVPNLKQAIGRLESPSAADKNLDNVSSNDVKNRISISAGGSRKQSRLPSANRKSSPLDNRGNIFMSSRQLRDQISKVNDVIKSIDYGAKEDTDSKRQNVQLNLPPSLRENCVSTLTSALTKVRLLIYVFNFLDVYI
jgi:hypothetical protein